MFFYDGGTNKVPDTMVYERQNVCIERPKNIANNLFLAIEAEKIRIRLVYILSDNGEY